MEGRYVDVTVISAEDLKKVNLIGKMHTYAFVWIDPYYRQSTAVDDGGPKPKWNQQLSFPVPEHFFQQPNARLNVEIYSKATLSDDKFVGAASIPVSEITHKADQEASTYQVKRKSGKVKGSVRLLIKVGEKTTIGTAPPPAPVPAYAHESKQHEAGGVPYAYPSSAAGAQGGAPYGYPPPAPYGQPAYGQAAYGQPYYQQPQYYQAQQPPKRRPGGGGLGMGLGAGLLAGALGGLIVGDMVDDAFDGGFDGGCDF